MKLCAVCVQRQLVQYTLCLQKTSPAIFNGNSRNHWRIFVMFGIHITEKVSNQQMLKFPTTPN